jgi:hypothetical protein
LAWNANNPVPWKRLAKEWLVIGVVVAIISLVVAENRSVASYLTILLGGVVYVGFGALLAKFGYQRKTLRQLRAEAAAQPPRVVGRTSTPSTRTKPAPTSRTGGSSTKRRR